MLRERQIREIPVEIKDIVGDQLGLYPDVITTGDKIANVWGILGLTNNADLAQIIGIEESNIPFLFDETFDVSKPLENDIDELFAVSVILDKKVEDLSQREKFLKSGNPLLRDKTPMQCLKQGKITEVLLLLYGQ